MIQPHLDQVEAVGRAHGMPAEIVDAVKDDVRTAAATDFVSRGEEIEAVSDKAKHLARGSRRARRRRRNRTERLRHEGAQVQQGGGIGAGAATPRASPATTRAAQKGMEDASVRGCSSMHA